MKKIVVKSKLRFSIFLLLVFTVGFFSCYSILGCGVAYSKSNEDYITYVVDKGDTLWGIARENTKKGEDVREVIYEIEKYNNINAHIIAGQEIKIPL